MQPMLWLVFAFGMADGAADPTGVWEISSLGGDRRVEVWMQGDRFIAHRTMYPEFDGERYRLEHLFRGRISGADIEGEMLVKEEGMPAFDPLRAFRGRLEADGTITLDGLPLKRTGEALKSEPPNVGARKRRIRRGQRACRPLVEDARWETMS